MAIDTAEDYLAIWEDTQSQCVACGEYIDYCQGHGAIGDPAGHAILEDHKNGDHSGCNPNGCDDAPFYDDADYYTGPTFMEFDG
jgi:hypothetical protein